MGVIDLDARVKKLEAGESGGGEILDQLAAEVTALDEQINGDGETDLGLAGDVTELKTALTVTKETINPTTGTAGTGGCFYETYGQLVHIHLNLTELTTTTTPSSPVYNNIYTLPDELTPPSTVVAFGGEATDPGAGTVRGIASASNNRVTVVTTGTTALVDIFYLLPTSASEAETTE